MSEHPGPPFPPQNTPQQPRKKKGFSFKVQMILFAASLVVAIGGFGVIITLNNMAGPEKQAKTLTEGDCVVLTGSGEEADAVKTPCDSPQAPYTVGLAGVDDGAWSCNDRFYKYAVPTPLRGKGVGLCLAINAQVGSCFDDIEAKTPPPLTDCGSARLKISEVFPQTSVEGGLCADDTVEVISYVGKGTSNFKSATICFVTP
ncbi:hypothetical protein DMH01_28410 [Amycolatopsis sp. WAC 04182]|uniref:LppU/SCO3897 family protein n=1 Tax=Amycolatopsis sp. WAC 04182 TaxID=2203198 RepID=UPI000F768BC3|nr:hypothetical protein [Amycolatopsis sp. WAC 04182]RSN57364.1 hypothetical protein DMH01_28410 [Amycolatopsis sp. WAC 04182]